MGNAKRSPKFKKRGADGRAIKGSRAVIADSPEPNCFPPATATAITRYRVRLSGSFTCTCARPFVSVRTEGAKTARALKFSRRRIGLLADSSVPDLVTKTVLVGEAI